jgi:RNA polymerase sigma factor (sigma-70 family)
VPSGSLPETAAALAHDGRPELWTAVRRLPEKQRTAVFCRTVLGMPYAELAELLESSQDAARRNVHEGLKTLRGDWSE